METPGNSDSGSKERRRTAYEIFFGEELPELPFCNSEDEAEYHRSFDPTANLLTPAISEIIDKEQPPDNLSESISKVSCGQCECCHRIQDILNSSRQSAAVQTSEKTQNISGKKVSDKINILSSEIIVQKQNALANDDIPEESDFSQISGVHKMKNTTIQKDEKKKGGRRKKSKSKLLPKKKPSKKRLESAQLSESDQENNHSSANKSEILEEQNLAFDKLLATTNTMNKSKNARQRLDFSNESSAGSNTDIPSKSLSKTLNLSPARPPKDALAANQSCSSITDHVKLQQSPKKRKLCKSYSEDALCTQEDITIDDYEPRRSCRERKLCKKYKAETAQKKNNYVHGAPTDRRIFKLPIDTTKDRTVMRALVRKLARRAGCEFKNATLSIEHEDFRCSENRRSRKLYSPENWLNSKMFSELCEDDD